MSGSAVADESGTPVTDDRPPPTRDEPDGISAGFVVKWIALDVKEAALEFHERFDSHAKNIKFLKDFKEKLGPIGYLIDVVKLSRELRQLETDQEKNEYFTAEMTSIVVSIGVTMLATAAAAKLAPVILGSAAAVGVTAAIRLGMPLIYESEIKELVKETAIELTRQPSERIGPSSSSAADTAWPVFPQNVFEPDYELKWLRTTQASRREIERVYDKSLWDVPDGIPRELIFTRSDAKKTGVEARDGLSLSEVRAIIEYYRSLPVEDRNKLALKNFIFQEKILEKLKKEKIWLPASIEQKETGRLLIGIEEFLSDEISSTDLVRAIDRAVERLVKIGQDGYDVDLFVNALHGYRGNTAVIREAIADYDAIQSDYYVDVRDRFYALRDEHGSDQVRAIQASKAMVRYLTELAGESSSTESDEQALRNWIIAYEHHKQNSPYLWSAIASFQETKAILKKGYVDIIQGGDDADVIIGRRSSLELPERKLKLIELSGEVGDDFIYNLGGRARLAGDRGKDSLYAGPLGDALFGGTGSDVLAGANGNDTLIGGPGADKLTGGGGSDKFVLLQARDSQLGKADTITDFERGVDFFDFRELRDHTGARAQLDFIGRKGFSGAEPEVRFERAKVFADIDGDGSADMEVDVVGVNRLGFGDFLL